MYCRMNEGGAFDTRMVRVDETGEQELFTGAMEQLLLAGVRHPV